MYDLKAVIHHISRKGPAGALEGQRGHYVAFIRTGSDVWCKYNDDEVSTVSTSEVLTNDAFVLSYSKRG